MGNTPAVAIGLALGLFVLVVVFVFLFFIRKKMLRGGRKKIAPLDQSKISLRTSVPINKDPSSEKLKVKKRTDRRPSPERLEIQAESIIPPTPKVYPRLTPSDSPGPPIGDKSPRSSQDIQRRDRDVTPTNLPYLHDEEKGQLPIIQQPQPQHPQIIQPQIIQLQPQHPQVFIEGGSTTEEPSFFVQRQPPLPMSESPSPPHSPGRSSRSLDRQGYAPDEDNPGPYPPAQPAQRRGLSRSSRQRSPLRGRGGRSSSSNS